MFEGIRNNYRYQSYARMCAKRGNLNLIFEEGIPRPRTSEKTMYLPAPHMMTSFLDRMKMLYYVNHESNHHEFNTDFELLQATPAINPMTTVAGNIWNAIEDDRVDYYSCCEWRGVKDNAELYFEWLIPVLIKEYTKVMESPLADNAYLNTRCAITCMSLLNRGRILSSCRTGAEQYRAILTPEAKEAVRKYEEGAYQKELFGASRSLEGCKVTADLAIRIAKEVFDEPKEGASEEETEKIIKELKEAIDAVDKELIYGTLQLVKHGTSEDERRGLEESAIITPPESSGEFKLLPLNEIKVADFENKKWINCSDEDSDTFVKNDTKTVLRNIARLKKHADGKKLAGVLRRLLQTKSRKKYKYGQKKGKLATNSLSRLIVGGSQANRIFKQKGDSLSLDVAVQLVVDYSSSMNGRKAYTAIISAGLLCDTISKSLRMPVEIIGFSGVTETRMSIYKTFDRPANSTTLEKRMAKGMSHMAQNADGEALLWAYNRLVVRNEKRRIMIVLSDGLPCAGRLGDISKLTHKVIDNIQDNSPIEILGIGIQSDAVARYYKDHIIIDEVNDLEDGLLTVVKSKILTGAKR